MAQFFRGADKYYVDNDNEIIGFMDETYAQNITINQGYWAEADADVRFVAGDQSVFAERYKTTLASRGKQFHFDRIRRLINMASGYQRQHRKSTMVTPILSDDQETSDQFTKLIYHINTSGGVLETISSAFEGALISGMNLLSTYVDYRKDPVNGDILTDNLSYNSFLIDPYFTKKDLSDCQTLWSRKYLTTNQAISILPGRENDIRSLSGNGNPDGRFPYQIQSYNFGKKNLLVCDEFWYLTSRKQKSIVDTDTGEQTEWGGDDDNLKEFLAMYPQTVVVSHEIPTVRLAIVVQGRCLYHGPNPLGIDRYPFVPVWAYYMPEAGDFAQRIQGITRGVRDSQFLYNRQMVTMLDMIESQITSGWKYKENALVNPKDVFMTGQGRGLALRAEAQMTDVEQILPPQIPPSILQLTEVLGNELSQISGINDELLGSAVDEKAGILSMLRQGAGLITLQGLFDNLDQSQRLLGRLHLELIQANWTPGKVARIINEEPSQEFYNRAFSKYDAVVEEAPLTSTQQQLAFQQRIYLRELGIPIPIEDLLENVNFTDKNKTIELIKQQEQAQQQQQQQQAQAQIEAMQVDNQTKMGFAASQQAQAQERLNKIRLDSAVAIEKLEKSDQDKTEAFLNLVKAVKEIQGIDMGQISQAMQMMLATQEAQERKDRQSEEVANLRTQRLQQLQNLQQQMEQAQQQQPQEAIFGQANGDQPMS